MNIRPLTVSSAVALSTFCQYRFTYFRALESFRHLDRAQRLLEACADHPEEGCIYGLFDLSNHLQGIIRFQRMTQNRQAWILSYAKAPDAPKSINVTSAIEQILRGYPRHSNLLFEAVAHYRNQPSQQVLSRIGFNICSNAKGYFTYQLRLPACRAA